MSGAEPREFDATMDFFTKVKLMDNPTEEIDYEPKDAYLIDLFGFSTQEGVKIFGELPNRQIAESITRFIDSSATLEQRATVLPFLQTTYDTLKRRKRLEEPMDFQNRSFFEIKAVDGENIEDKFIVDNSDINLYTDLLKHFNPSNSLDNTNDLVESANRAFASPPTSSSSLSVQLKNVSNHVSVSDINIFSFNFRPIVVARLNEDVPSLNLKTGFPIVMKLSHAYYVDDDDLRNTLKLYIDTGRLFSPEHIAIKRPDSRNMLIQWRNSGSSTSRVPPAIETTTPTQPTAVATTPTQPATVATTPTQSPPAQAISSSGTLIADETPQQSIIEQARPPISSSGTLIADETPQQSLAEPSSVTLIADETPAQSTIEPARQPISSSGTLIADETPAQSIADDLGSSVVHVDNFRERSLPQLTQSSPELSPDIERIIDSTVSLSMSNDSLNRSIGSLSSEERAVLPEINTTIAESKEFLSNNGLDGVFLQRLENAKSAAAALPPMPRGNGELGRIVADASRASAEDVVNFPQLPTASATVPSPQIMLTIPPPPNSLPPQTGRTIPSHSGSSPKNTFSPRTRRTLPPQQSPERLTYNPMRSPPAGVPTSETDLSVRSGRSNTLVALSEEEDEAILPGQQENTKQSFSANVPIPAERRTSNLDLQSKRTQLIERRAALNDSLNIVKQLIDKEKGKNNTVKLERLKQQENELTEISAKIRDPMIRILARFPSPSDIALVEKALAPVEKIKNDFMTGGGSRSIAEEIRDFVEEKTGKKWIVSEEKLKRLEKIKYNHIVFPEANGRVANISQYHKPYSLISFTISPQDDGNIYTKSINTNVMSGGGVAGLFFQFLVLPYAKHKLSQVVNHSTIKRGLTKKLRKTLRKRLNH